MLIHNLRPMRRALVMVSAVVAASAALFAATEPAHAFMRMPHGFARMPHGVARMPVMPSGAMRPAMTTPMPRAADPGNVELMVKVLNTPHQAGRTRSAGYATGETMIHIESGLDQRGPGKTASARKLKRNDGAQRSEAPTFGWTYRDLHVELSK
jgi:hypothetical protein